jgi:hypothetical protein
MVEHGFMGEPENICNITEKVCILTLRAVERPHFVATGHDVRLSALFTAMQWPSGSTNGTS